MKLKKAGTVMAIILCLSMLLGTTAFATGSNILSTDNLIVSKNMETGEITYDYLAEPRVALPDTFPPKPPVDFPDALQQEEFAPRWIIENNLTVANPYIWGVVRLVTEWKDGSYSVGTGFVTADHCIVTAAHCAYNAGKSGKWCERIIIYSGRNYPNSYYLSQTIRLNGDYMTTVHPKNDWAVIEVNEAIGQSTGWFGWSTSTSTGNLVKASGYPGDRLTPEQKYSMGKVFTAYNDYLDVTCDFLGGMSGGPICRVGDNTAVGIVSVQADGTKNYATRITSSLSSILAEYRS